MLGCYRRNQCEVAPENDPGGDALIDHLLLLGNGHFVAGDSPCDLAPRKPPFMDRVSALPRYPDRPSGIAFPYARISWSEQSGSLQPDQIEYRQSHYLTVSVSDQAQEMSSCTGLTGRSWWKRILYKRIQAQTKCQARYQDHNGRTVEGSTHWPGSNRKNRNKIRSGSKDRITSNGRSRNENGNDRNEEHNPIDLEDENRFR